VRKNLPGNQHLCLHLERNEKCKRNSEDGNKNYLASWTGSEVRDAEKHGEKQRQFKRKMKTKSKEKKSGRKIAKFEENNLEEKNQQFRKRVPTHSSHLTIFNNLGIYKFIIRKSSIF